MTPQLKSALLRSLGTVAPIAVLLGAALSVQLLWPGNATAKEVTTLGLSALATAMPFIVRGLIEGLNDAQRNAVGAVLKSDVTPTVLNDTADLLAPLATKALAKAGLKVTSDQVQSVAKQAATQVEDALTAAIAAQHASTAVEPSGRAAAVTEAPAASEPAPAAEAPAAESAPEESAPAATVTTPPPSGMAPSV